MIVCYHKRVAEAATDSRVSALQPATHNTEYNSSNSINVSQIIVLVETALNFSIFVRNVIGVIDVR